MTEPKEQPAELVEPPADQSWLEMENVRNSGDPGEQRDGG